MMITSITSLTVTLSQANVFIDRRIDLIVILILIGLTIFKELLRAYFEQYSLAQQDVKLNIGKILNIAIVPLLYVFVFVFIYRVQLILIYH